MDGGCGSPIWDCFVSVLGCEQVKGVDDIPVFPVSLFFSVFVLQGLYHPSTDRIFIRCLLYMDCTLKYSVLVFDGLYNLSLCTL